jgi:hypothetical protein
MILVVPLVICLSGHTENGTDFIYGFSIFFDLKVPSEPDFLRGAK